MVVIIEYHLLGVNGVDVQKYLAARLHYRFCFGELLDHMPRLDVVAVQGVANIHPEAMIIQQLNSLTVSHLLHSRHLRAPAMLGKQSHGKIHGINP